MTSSKRQYRHTKRSLRESSRLGLDIVEMESEFCNQPCCMTIEKHGTVDLIVMHTQKYKKHRLAVLTDRPDSLTIHPDIVIAVLLVAFSVIVTWMAGAL